MKKYPALHNIATLLKFCGVLIIVFGIFFSVYVIYSGGSLFGSGFGSGVRVVGVICIIASLIGGLVIYAMGDFFICVMDIENNTRFHHPIATATPQPDSITIK